MDVKEIREALIKLRDFAKRLDCDYQEECTPGEDDMCESCKHVYIAELALAALSTIDPDAIRRECADRAVAWYRAGQLIPAHKESFAIKQLRAAILGVEPARDDGKVCD